MPILGAIVGATAVGKTAVAIELAESLGAEIICMDSRQVFRGFRIGTAQPTAAERARVSHHQVDFLDPTESYSAARFAADVKKLCADHAQTRFLLVGGTGMYLQTLCAGLSSLPPSDSDVRETLRARYEQEGVDALYAEALRIDPGIRERIMPGDFQRLLRVLEVHVQGAGRWSDYLGKRSGGIGEIPTIWLDCERDLLYERINARVEKMFVAGWVDEVRKLSTEIPDSAPAWQSLGYREIRAALASGQKMSSLHEPLRQQTRHYAKRQLTWFRNQGQSTRIDLDQPRALDSMLELLS